ncbi:hypothetical protein HHK36_001877 [Tetracentron sinense]|uniref:Uncharacterized protein n=1 Tax=Tetracentron sinense TaxID=13715 RepID=A0A835DSG9_TETSI|nr:hypothetical protein HHK36_001877 [Tetracentron sinense]
MKKSGVFVASIAAASAIVISASSSSSSTLVSFHNPKNQDSHEFIIVFMRFSVELNWILLFLFYALISQEAVSSKDRDNSSSHRSPSTDKFAPKFDGLRFIETLVTAHR